MTHCGHSLEYVVQQVGTENQGFRIGPNSNTVLYYVPIKFNRAYATG